MENKWMGADCNQNWLIAKKERFINRFIAKQVHCALWAVHLKPSVKQYMY